jgi:hypothetical protein
MQQMAESQKTLLEIVKIISPYIDKNELMMDLEVNSKHPERYDVWVKKLKSLNVPNDFRPPFISNINVEKYFNIKVNPI